MAVKQTRAKRGRKREAVVTPRPAPLCLGLADPGMTPLLRAGLGGLAASLRASLLESNPRAAWPATVSLGGGTFTVEPRRVVVDWGAAKPEVVLKALFSHAFRLRKPYGLIDLPGTYDPLAPPAPELLAALQAALKRTFLQHGKTTTKAGALKTVTFTTDDTPFTASFQPYSAFAHQGAWAEVAEGLSKPVELAGWAYPGAAQRHVAYGSTKQEYRAADALCAAFSVVGTVSFDMPRGGGGALVIPEPSDLVGFAVARPRMSPRRVPDAYVGGAGDAVLAVQLALRMDEVSQHRRAVRATHGVLLRSTAWAAQQKSRVQTVGVETFAVAVLDTYDAAARVLPTRLHAIVPKKGEKASYFATPSAFRAFVAENLAIAKSWFAGFATATTPEKPPRFLHYYREKDGLGALWGDERKGLIVMIEHLDAAEKSLVRSVHIAIRQRFGAIAEESKDNPATMKNRFESERDRWRHAFAGSKTPEQIRAALADLWSRAGTNRELQQSWEAVIPLLRAEHWQTARDLALVALASYRGDGVDHSNTSKD